MIGETPKNPLLPCAGHTLDEVEALARLRAYLPEIVIMLEHGVFEFKGGHAELHRDAEGTLQFIDIKERSYRRKLSTPPKPPIGV